MNANKAIENDHQLKEEGLVGKPFSGAAIPVTFSDTVGLFTPSAGPASGAAVLFLSPWGFEEMCTRKFWRVLAEQLSQSGIASLRFDYAGTGDALGAPFDGGLDLWSKTALDAASRLEALSGCDKVILITQGLGAAVALDIARRLPSAEGIAFLAPTLSGRAYLRELAVWSKMIDESMGLSEDQREKGDGISVAGLKLPEPLAADIRALNLMNVSDLQAPAALVLTRPGRPNDVAFAERLRGFDVRVEDASYDGYDDLVSNPTVAVIPEEAGRRVLDWVKSIADAHPAKPGQDLPHLPPLEPLMGDGFCETPLRLGDGDRMFGVLCEPTGVRTGATAILLTTAYDRHAGWGRTSVAMARELARSGIPSLRFDSANVADSPPRPDAPNQVLYSETQYLDVVAALDLVESRKLLPAFVVGRCSGGFLGFQAAIRDMRCSGLITVNPYAFIWDYTKSVDEALRFVPRSLGTYGQKFLQLETVRRLLNGSIDARSAFRNIVASLIGRLSHLQRPLRDKFAFLSAEHTAVMQRFALLSQRNVRMSLIYSEQDIGLEHFSLHFGRDGAGLSRFDNAHLVVIPNADHNLTPAHAREIYVREIKDMALDLNAPVAPAPLASGAGKRSPKTTKGSLPFRLV